MSSPTTDEDGTGTGRSDSSITVGGLSETELAALAVVVVVVEVMVWSSSAPFDTRLAMLVVSVFVTVGVFVPTVRYLR